MDSWKKAWKQWTSLYPCHRALKTDKIATICQENSHVK